MAKYDAAFREKQTGYVRINLDISLSRHIAYSCIIILAYIFVLPANSPVFIGELQVTRLSKIVAFFIRAERLQKQRLPGKQVISRRQVVFQANVTIVFCICAGKQCARRIINSHLIHT